MFRRFLKLRFCLLVTFVLISGHGVAEVATKIDNHLDVTPYMSFYEDKEGRLSLTEILTADRFQLFKSLVDSDKTRGYSQSVFWMKLELDQIAGFDASSSEYWLELADSRFDEVIVYSDIGEGYNELYRTGAAYPFDTRGVANRQLLFPTQHLTNGNESALFIKIKASSPIFLGATLWEKEAYLSQQSMLSSIEGAYFGILLIMVLYNIFLYLRVGDYNHLVYVGYVLVFGMVMATALGYSHQYLWPEAGLWNSKSISLLSLTVILMGGVFARGYLQIKEFLPRADRIILYLMALTLVIGLMVVIGPLDYRAYAVVFTVSVSVIVLYVASKRYQQGSRMAGFYLAGWSCLVAAAMIHLMTDMLNFVEVTTSIFVLMLGSVLEVLVFSLGMADRINTERMAKHHALSMQKAASAELEKANIKLHSQAKELEMALQMSNKHNRLKEDFLCSVSHELRTPIHAITGSLEFIDRDSLAENNGKIIETIENSSNQLLGLVDDILEFKEDEQQLSLQNINLLEIITHNIQLLLPRSKKTNWTVSEDSSPIPNLMIGDKERITQILFNLFSNALKYGKGKVNIGLYHHEHEESDEILIEVWNDGDTIPLDKQIEIFEPFTQGTGGYARTRGGLGIGLAVCKKMAELMGGGIHLTSHENVGTKFSVRVPLGKISGAEKTTLQSHPLVRLIQQQGEQAEKWDKVTAQMGDMPLKVKRPEVLIVEDNVVNRKILKKMVMGLGYSVTEAKDGHEGFIFATKKQYAAILMDCQMPFLDGFLTTENIRKLCSWGNQIPIIAITANVLEADRQKCLLAGMNDFLPKPAKRQDIEDCLNRWVYT